MSWNGFDGGVEPPVMSFSSSESSFSESSQSSWASPPALPHNYKGANSSNESISTIVLNSSPTKPSLLRKKSGDVVKSSLRLPALAKCKSASSVSLKKSVSFASRLEKIKMFDGTDSPSTVSTNENSPLESPSSGRHGYFSWDWDSGLHNANLPKEDFSDDYENESTSDEDLERKSWEIVSSDVASNVSFASFRSENRPVFLQSVSASPDKKSLLGFIMVKNLAFEKKINVKLTTNKWKSSIIISNSTYIQSFRSTNYDQFKFSMPLSNYRTVIDIELVIKYEAGGPSQVFWDNNNGKNYHISVKALPSASDSRKNSAPEFEDLVNRLVNIRRDDKYDHDDDVEYTTPRSKPSFNSRYNFNNEDVPSRPVLKSSYSNSDVATVKPRYSNSYRAKQKSETRPDAAAAEANPFFAANVPKSKDTNFNSKSYTDLLNSMCFYKGPPKPSVSPTKSSSSINCKDQDSFTGASRTSAASTFHSFSDSIHT
ncbi:CBM21 domain-containing protein [[Candida] zeylanoides]